MTPGSRVRVRIRERGTSMNGWVGVVVEVFTDRDMSVAVQFPEERKPIPFAPRSLELLDEEPCPDTLPAPPLAVVPGALEKWKAETDEAMRRERVRWSRIRYGEPSDDLLGAPGYCPDDVNPTGAE